MTRRLFPATRRLTLPRCLRVLALAVRALSFAIGAATVIASGVAWVVSIEACTLVLWRAIVSLTTPPHTDPRLLTASAFWIRYAAWGHSVDYWNHPSSLLVFVQRTWNQASISQITIALVLPVLAPLWLYSVFLRRHAQRSGLSHVYSWHCLVRLPPVDIWFTTFFALYLKTLLSIAVLMAVARSALVLGPELAVTVLGQSGAIWELSLVAHARYAPLILAFGLLCGLFFSVVGCRMLAWRSFVTIFRSLPPRCRHCGYLLPQRTGLCPECGPLVRRRRTRRSHCHCPSLPTKRRKWAILFLLFVGPVGLEIGRAQARMSLRHFARTDLTRPPKSQLDSVQYVHQLWTSFDTLAQCRLGREYHLLLNHSNVRLTMTSTDNTTLQIEWSENGGPYYSRVFSPAKPWEQPESLDRQMARIPVLIIDDSVMFFQIGDYIALDPGPNRVDVRIHGVASFMTSDAPDITPSHR